MNERTYERVIDYLKMLIQENKIQCGGKIPSERVLAETLGLGRNSVREALRMMEHTGMLKSCQGKGNYLVNMPEKSLGNVFSMMLLTGQSNFHEVSRLRRVLEIEAFLTAVEHADERDMEHLHDALKGMKNKDFVPEYDRQFHQCLIQAGGNQLLKVVMDSLDDLCDAEIEHILSSSTKEELEEWYEIHRKIYVYLKNGNKKDGILQLHRHYDKIDEMLTKIIKIH